MENMATITLTQSSSLALSNSTAKSFLDKENALNTLQYEIPSPPDELCDIASKRAISTYTKPQMTTTAAGTGRSTRTSRFGNRNPYLPYLSPTSSSRSEAPSTKDPKILEETASVDDQRRAPTNGSSDISSSSTLEYASRSSGVSTLDSLPRTSTEQTDPGLSLRAPTREPPKPPTLASDSALPKKPGTNEQKQTAVLEKLRIETTTPSGPSLITNPRIIKLDKRCYVSTDMPKPAEISRLWDESYRPLLKLALQHSATAKDDNESAMALEFYMAGTSSKDLKPSVLVTCCSSQKKKTLKSTLGELRWLKDSGLQYFVRVDRSFGYRTQNIGMTTVRTYARETRQPLPKIEVRLSFDPTTLCGVGARISSIPGQAYNDEFEVVRFTIGGLININGEYGYLTAGHPFRPSPTRQQSSNSSMASSNTENSDSDSSVTIEAVTKWNNSLPTPDIAVETEINVPFRQLEHQGVVSSRDSPKSSLVNFTMYRYEPTNADWAFIIPSPNNLVRLNTIQIPGNYSPTIINKTLSNADLCSSPVWIAAGSGLRRGSLNATPTSVFLGGHCHDARMITLDYPLTYGDSGSWVINGDRLCGMIIAGRDILPWAYIVCIEDVFRGIRDGLGGEGFVGLPSSLKHQTQPVVNRSMSGSVSDRVDDIVIPVVLEGPSIEEKEKNDGSHVPQIEPRAETYVRGYSLWVLSFTLILSMFLDDSGTGTSLPKITDHFDSLDDIGWYASAFFLTKATFHTPFTFCYRRYSAKWIFFASVLMLEVGSLVCALSTSSVMFIIGRSVSAVGSSGIYAGVVFIGFTLAFRSTLWAWLLLAARLASVVRPVLFGALVDKITWRWTYYIDMPIGAAVSILVLGCSKVLPRSDVYKLPLSRMVWIMLGTGVLTSLLLSLNWAGRRYSVKDFRVLVPLVLPSSLVLFSMGSWKAFLPEASIRPSAPSYLRCMVLCAALFSTGLSIMVYYLSIWFQAIKGVSALESGIMSLALMLGAFLAYIPTVLTRARPKYQIFLLATASILATIGAGLTSLFTAESPRSVFIGFQAILGIGVGIGVHFSAIQAMIYAQDENIITVYRSIVFTEALMACIFHSVAQSMFVNTLRTGLKAHIAHFDPKLLLHTGVTTLASTFSSEMRPLVIQVYNTSLINVFYLGTALLGFSIFGTLITLLHYRWLRMAKYVQNNEFSHALESDKAWVTSWLPGTKNVQNSEFSDTLPSNEPIMTQVFNLRSDLAAREPIQAPDYSRPPSSTRATRGSFGAIEDSSLSELDSRSTEVVSNNFIPNRAYHQWLSELTTSTL